MHEARADQFANGSPCGVLGIASLGIGVQNQGQLVHREPGRVFIEEINYEEHKAELTHSFQINLQFNWEDRFRLVGYAGQPELVEAVTDNHVTISPAQPASAGWNATTRGLRQVTASIKLNPVPVTARTLETFRIKWGLVALGEPAILATAGRQLTPAAVS